MYVRTRWPHLTYRDYERSRSPSSRAARSAVLPARDVRSGVTRLRGTGGGRVFRDEESTVALAETGVASSGAASAASSGATLVKAATSKAAPAKPKGSISVDMGTQEHVWVGAHWTWSERRGYAKVAEHWTLVPLGLPWSETNNPEGIPKVITLLLDQRVEEALAMVKKDPGVIFEMSRNAAKIPGSNLLHVLAHRGEKEWGTKLFQDLYVCTYVRTRVNLVQRPPCSGYLVQIPCSGCTRLLLLVEPVGGRTTWPSHTQGTISQRI